MEGDILTPWTISMFSLVDTTWCSRWICPRHHPLQSSECSSPLLKDKLGPGSVLVELQPSDSFPKTMPCQGTLAYRAAFPVISRILILSLDPNFFTVIPLLETMVFFPPADLHQHFGAPSDQVRSAYGPASEKEGSHRHPFLFTGLGLPMQISLPSPHRPSLHTKGVCKNPAFMKPQKASSLHSLRARGAYLTRIPINNGYR